MRTLIPVALAVCALALTACGTDDPAAASDAATPEQERQEAALAFAKCMREEGIDMPDPKFDGGGGMMMRAPDGVSRETMEAAEKACRKHLDSVKPPELSEEEQQEFKEAALAHARCLREHGIDVPDPTVGEDGRVEMRIPRGSGIAPESSKFREAQEACRDDLPGSRGGPGSSTESRP